MDHIQPQNNKISSHMDSKDTGPIEFKSKMTLEYRIRELTPNKVDSRDNNTDRRHDLMIQDKCKNLHEMINKAPSINRKIFKIGNQLEKLPKNNNFPIMNKHRDYWEDPELILNQNKINLKKIKRTTIFRQNNESESKMFNFPSDSLKTEKEDKQKEIENSFDMAHNSINQSIKAYKEKELLETINMQKEQYVQALEKPFEREKLEENFDLYMESMSKVIKMLFPKDKQDLLNKNSEKEPVLIKKRSSMSVNSRNLKKKK